MRLRQGRSRPTRRGRAPDSPRLTLRLMRWISLGNAGLDEVDEEPTSDPFVPTGRDDCDRQFRDVLSDEAIAVGHLGVVRYQAAPIGPSCSAISP